MLMRTERLDTVGALGAAAGFGSIASSGSAAAERSAAGGSVFGGALERARSASAGDGDRRAQELRGAAEDLVAATFVLPILKQMRESNQAWGPFAPGSFEKQFGPIADGHVASRLVKAQRLPIVEALTRRFEAGVGGGGLEVSA